MEVSVKVVDLTGDGVGDASGVWLQRGTETVGLFTQNGCFAIARYEEGQSMPSRAIVIESNYPPRIQALDTSGAVTFSPTVTANQLFSALKDLIDQLGRQ